MTVVLRGFSLDIHSIEYLIYGDIFPYLVPLVLFFPQNIFFYKNVFKIIVLFGFFYLFFDSIFIKDLLNRDVANTFSKKIIETFSKSLALPATFLILTYSYQSKNVKIFAMFIAVIAILFAIIRARRGLLFILISPVLFAVIISLMESKKKISIVFISLISVGLIGLYGLQIFNESSLFSAFRSRVDEDTRSGVEDCFKSDMKRSDWIIGKGINGKYYCPGVDLGNTTGYRSVIETDYENIILKGGIVSLSLLLLITIPAAIKGIFHSKNILSKAAGFGILAWLMSLYPSEGVAFSLNYIILWLLVGICYNKTIRDIPESTMKYNFSGISSISTEI
jgi:hypothetical protein